MTTACDSFWPRSGSLHLLVLVVSLTAGQAEYGSCAPVKAQVLVGGGGAAAGSRAHVLRRSDAARLLALEVLQVGLQECR